MNTEVSRRGTTAVVSTANSMYLQRGVLLVRHVRVVNFLTSVLVCL